MAQAVTGTFTETESSGDFFMNVGKFNVTLDFAGSATVLLKRSFDRGTTWHTVATWTADATEIKEEVEVGVVYKLECTAYTNDVVYRVSR